jgi:hypothetical protein
LSEDLQSIGAGVTASNSPYISAGYDLYSTTSPSDHNTGGGGNNSGAFTVGTRLTSLPSFITSITSAGANSSAKGYAPLYTDIDNPAGGIVQAGFTYNFTTTPSVEDDLVAILIGNGAPSTFYIGAIINTSGASQDDDDFMRLRQTTGGSADSGLISTRNTNNGTVDLVLFQITGAAPGDVYTLSGVESQPNPSSGDYNVPLAGLTFTASAVPEPNSAFLLLPALVGLTAFYKFRR